MKPILLVLVFLVSCSKRDNRQYSEWEIDGERFNSNEATVTIGKASMSLNIPGNNNSFSIAFAFGAMNGPSRLPAYGTWPIRKTNNQHPDSVTLKFYADGVFYHISPSAISELHGSRENGKATYTLPATEFINYNTSSKVTIKGVFREP